MTGAPPFAAPAIWEETAGRRLTVYAARGSQAAKAASKELRDAERSIASLEALLGRAPDEAWKPAVYLVDPVADLDVDDLSGVAGTESASEQAGMVGSEAIVRVLQAGILALPITEPLTRLLLARWFGPTAAAAGSLVTGIAGVVAAEAEAGPSVAEADQWVRGQLAEGLPVSILAPSAPGASGAAPALSLAPTSFVGFLIATFGAESLTQFLTRYDPARRDEAAVAVFRQPMAALDQEWRASLRRSEPRPTLVPTFRYFFRLMATEKGRYAELLFWQVLAAVLAMTLPLVSGCVFGALDDSPGGDAFCRRLIPNSPLTKERLAVIALAVLAVYVVDAAGSLRRARVGKMLFADIERSLQERMFGHLQRLSHAYHGEAKVGDVSSRLMSDVGNIAGSMEQIFGITVLLAITSLTAAVTAFLKSWKVGILLLLVAPVLLVTNRVLGARMAKAGYEGVTLTGETVAAVQENLSAHSAVKAFGLEGRMLDAFSGRVAGIRAANLRVGLAQQLFQTTAMFTITVAQLLVVGVGGYLVVTESIKDAGTLVTLFGLLPLMLNPLPNLAAATESAQIASGSIDRVNEILDHPIEIADRVDARPLPPPAQEIHFEAVNFAYSEDRPILRGLDLTLPVGTYVAVVGPSGSGKSTLVNLLMRFWDPDAGRVLIDGQDLRDMRLASLRSKIGLVFQDTFVFNSTLRDNIAIGRPGATDAEIEAAARAARLDSLTQSLPAGFDTVLGERGARMSGGQRQRLAIARAILRDPPILILDEATSALDASTEAGILDTLQAVVRGRTTITITHRLAMAAAADVVIVLDQGRVVEQGPHTELVTAGGLYQRLWDEQTGRSGRGGDDRIGLEESRLRNVGLFADLPAETLAALADQLKAEQFAPEEDVVRQGDPGDKLYIIQTGAAEVLVDDGRGERRVNIMKEGAYFGELALLTNQVRSATVRTTAPTEVFSLAKEEFLDLVQRQPSLRERLSQLVFARRVAYDAAALAAGITSADGTH